MLSILALGIALGAAALVSGSSEKEGAREKEATAAYDKEYCREHLSASSYDNWQVQDVAKALQDSRVRAQLEKYLDHYSSFERAVDELVADGEIRL